MSVLDDFSHIKKSETLTKEVKQSALSSRKHSIACTRLFYDRGKIISRETSTGIMMKLEGYLSKERTIINDSFMFPVIFNIEDSILSLVYDADRLFPNKDIKLEAHIMVNAKRFEDAFYNSLGGISLEEVLSIQSIIGIDRSYFVDFNFKKHHDIMKQIAVLCLIEINSALLRSSFDYVTSCADLTIFLRLVGDRRI